MAASALGTVTLTAKVKKSKRGAIFIDRITVVGDAAYPSGGTTGLKAALNALTGDGRAPFAVIDAGVNGGYMSHYNIADDKLIVLLGDADGVGVFIEADGVGNLSGQTFTYVVLST